MRNVIDLNHGWKSIREDAGLPDATSEDWKKSWQDVELPHTWNAADGMDGNGCYYQGPRCGAVGHDEIQNPREYDKHGCK